MRGAEFLLKIGFLVFVVCLGVSGCGGASTQNRTDVVAVVAQLFAITRAYFEALRANERGPANKEELLPFLKNWKDREQAGTEQDLRSERDGQEFVIHWGVDLRHEDLRIDPAKMVVLAYEKTG